MPSDSGIFVQTSAAPLSLRSDLHSRLSLEKIQLTWQTGTSGTPKGVMLSHDNITWTSRAIASFVEAPPAQEQVLSYLPLGHIAAQLFEIYVPITIAGTVFFPKQDVLSVSSLRTLMHPSFKLVQNHLLETLQTIRPTIFFAVPAIWEKLQAIVTDDCLTTASGQQKSLSAWVWPFPDDLIAQSLNTCRLATAACLAPLSSSEARESASNSRLPTSLCSPRSSLKLDSTAAEYVSMAPVACLAMSLSFSSASTFRSTISTVLFSLASDYVHITERLLLYRAGGVMRSARGLRSRDFALR